MKDLAFLTPENSQSLPFKSKSKAPETIVNPVTGDRMTILHSSYQSQGNYVKIRFDLPPGAKGSPPILLV